MTHPDTSTTRGKIEVMEAAEKGEKIEVARRECGDLRWTQDESPTWNWSMWEYRIAPKPSPPKYRPWRMEEVPVGIVIQHKITHFRWLITGASKNWIHTEEGVNTYGDMLNDYTLLDGSPCGMREEGE